jgi:hypothetical protein
MGMGDFLSSKAENDYTAEERKREAWYFLFRYFFPPFFCHLSPFNFLPYINGHEQKVKEMPDMLSYLSFHFFPSFLSFLLFPSSPSLSLLSSSFLLPTISSPLLLSQWSSYH